MIHTQSSAELAGRELEMLRHQVARLSASNAALQDKNTKLIDFVLAHEQWEADCLNGGGLWVDVMIATEGFIGVQRLRNLAMDDSGRSSNQPELF